MTPWSVFSTADPELAFAVRSLLCQYGPGLGYLATIRPDGGPRLHPVSPVILDGGLFCFLVPSKKRDDLERDNRYALHSYPPEHSDDGAYLSGTVIKVTDRSRIAAVAQAASASWQLEWRLFELSIDMATVVRRSQCTRPGEMPAPASHRSWRPGLTGHRGCRSEAAGDPVQ